MQIFCGCTIGPEGDNWQVHENAVVRGEYGDTPLTTAPRSDLPCARQDQPAPDCTSPQRADFNAAMATVHGQVTDQIPTITNPRIPGSPT